MIGSSIHDRRTCSAFLAAALLGALTPALLPATQAEAAPPGRVCLFQDREGAGGAGHVAWAIRDPKDSGHWIWGATEGPANGTYVPAGSSNGSWIKGGTWKQLRASISLARYDNYRCTNTAGGNLKAAQQTYGRMKANGYAVLTNNCLTKSLEIFRSFAPALTGSSLPEGRTTPNDYFENSLDGARGWEAVRSY
ncbi:MULTISPECIES: Tat pathway signal protein [unclassified Streptomyces]|uniref:Tat pathway signal protein n=1 Tax=unclassified Streptomyces TaxID=2593676 RepID=UPI002E15A749|nr:MULTISPECIES: Tat pathway signal protein [unclassified Streptomyces]WSR23952.1 Tat pathway signal protein [Streptomyces sp. NBC_01205]